MAYQAFYNKYRPQTFDEVVGQKAVVATLKNAIKENKIAHAYLFCGPRGTGKTTMARLFAKALNCQNGIGKQCNNCDSCQAIIKGEHPDVVEIDAASNSTVDSVRQLIDSVSYQPIMSRYKIYIIDEVHNMSNSAFNALLKTLEEPPSFVVFILATTEPQKILPTILSRVQRFDFSKVVKNDLIFNMDRILKKENISFEEGALELIASLSDGGVRDSLSLLDQAVSYSGDNLTVHDVDTLFGLMSIEDEIHLINLISDKKTDEVIKLIKSKYDKGIDIIRLHNDLIAIYKDALIYSVTKDSSLLEKANVEQIKLIKDDVSTLNNRIKELIVSKRDYRSADNVFAHFELSILDLMTSENAHPTPILQKEKPLEVAGMNKRVQETEQLKTKPVVITKTNIKKGFEAKKVEETKTEDKIVYNSDDILNLMEQADREERLKVESKWGLLQNLFASKTAYEARALASCKLRLVAKDILLVTSNMMSEINKINNKSSQTILMDIAKDVFDKAYHVLPIADREFKDCYISYKTGKKVEMKEPNIDFGDEKKETNSTQFFDELMNG